MGVNLARLTSMTCLDVKFNELLLYLSICGCFYGSFFSSRVMEIKGVLLTGVVYFRISFGRPKNCGSVPYYFQISQGFGF